ncbi:MAG: PilZ domain-containing protein [Deltaproteobacteria bacterium]|nr:PilZ domain-containing protein [Deltaproteobacteria bacterium]
MNDEEKYAEKRRTPRAPIGVIVRIETDEGGRHYYSRNLSTGGAFLLAEEPLEEESRISLELFLPLVSTPVKAKGEVVWKQRQEPSGFAVKFTEISENARKIIRWVVDRYLGTSNGK